MPNKPVQVTRGEVAELATQVGGLQREVHNLIGVLDDAVQKANQAKKDAAAAKTAAQENPSRDEVRQSRRHFIAWSLVILSLSTLVTIGTLTTTVSQCFLRQSHVLTVNGKKVVGVGPGGTWGEICGWIPGYKPVIKKGDQQQKQFRNLLLEIPKNSAENVKQNRHNAQQDREIAHLKAVLREHGISP